MAQLESAYFGYINKSFIKNVIEESLGQRDIHLKNVVISPLCSGNGENYCSDIYEVKVTYETKSDPEAREENLVVKSIPNHRKKLFKHLNIFNREYYFYKHLMTQMDSLMQHSGEQWTLGPRMIYGTSTPVDTIIMQNLLPLGFKMKIRQEGLNQLHSIIALQKLAQYHALSLAIISDADQKSAVLEHYAYGLVNKESCQSDSFKTLFRSQLQKLISILHDDPEFVQFEGKLLEYNEHFTERVLAAVYPLQGQLNVLNHGDFWTNNILFRYGSDPDIPLEVRFIDFQLCFYGSLGFDVNFFLNTSVNLDVLQSHRQSLVDSYAKTFLETLNRLHYTQDQLSKEYILREINEREPYGFFVSFAFFPLMSMHQNDSMDNSLEKLKDPSFAKGIVELMFTSNAMTIETLKHSVKRFVHLGIL